MTSAFLCMVLIPSDPPPAAGSNLPAAAEVEKVRRLLNGIEFKEQRATLIKMGDEVFPAYQVILADPKSKQQHLRRALHVIANVKAQRGRFVEPAVQLLGNEAWEVRWEALELLGQIGSSRDIAPVVALLTDERAEVAYRAANTLAAIGDQRTVTAMDVWLKTGNHRNDGDLLRHVKKCRDDLQKRLDEEAKKLRDGG